MKLLGWCSNPYPIMSSADLYVQSSRIESYGITIREAQILGKVVLSTNTDGAKENILSGEDGYICGYRELEIADAIIKLINDNALFERILHCVGKKDYLENNKKSYQIFEGIIEHE